MANSTFPMRIGGRNGSNSGLIRALKGNRIPHAFCGTFVWYVKFDILLAGTLDADGVQEFDLHTYIGSNPSQPHSGLFPANVRRCGTMLYIREVFAGGTNSACTLEFGDAGDPNGLHTAVDVWTGSATGYRDNTTAAAEYAPRFEAAFIPSLTLRTTTSTIAALTTGECWIGIKFQPESGVS
jgi:hypothetical protein